MSPFRRSDPCARDLRRRVARIAIGALLLAAAAGVSSGAVALASQPPPAAGSAGAGEEPGATQGTEAGSTAEGTQPSGRERRRGGGRRCAVKLAGEAESLIAGEPTTLLGVLTCPSGEGEDEQTVTIEQHTLGTHGFVALGTATTEAEGAFQYPLSDGVSSDSVFRAVVADSRSSRRAVKVLPAVTLAGPAAGTHLLTAGRRADAATREARTVLFSGTVAPLAAGASVVLERESATGTGWRRIGRAEVGADGRYSIAHTFSAAGPATIRVVVHARGLRGAASEALAYEVEPRQNPRLTISASPTAALAYGQPVTIAGTAAAGPGTLLTLLAGTPHSQLAAVASARAGEGGRYAFPTQSPTDRTVYRVRSAGASSIALRETVTPLLSLQATPAALAEGQSLRVCGTVTPAGAGETVYLQREDPGGAGFHTVAEAAPEVSGGGFCLQRTAVGAGAQRYRVKVAETAELRPAASKPFAVAVTPASASELAQQLPEAESTQPAGA